MPSFIGKYRGIVTDNKDPEHRGRLKCKCPQVFGEEVLDWAIPCVPYGGDSGTGFFSIPKKGSSVWLEFEQGDANRPVWVGVWWAAPEDKTEAADVTHKKEKQSSGPWDEAETGDAKRDVPDNHAWQTKSGHRIELDDTDGQTKIKITDRKGQHIIIRSEDGKEKIYMKDAADNRFLLDATSGKRRILMQDGAGSVVLLDAEKGDVCIASAKDLSLLAGENLYIGCKSNREETVGGNHNISVMGSGDWDVAGALKLAKSSGDVNIASGSKAAARTDDQLAAATETAGGSAPHSHGLSSGKVGQGSSKVKIG
jgi:hypothetical protein